MIMARNEDGTYSQVGFVKDNVGIDTEYIYDKDGDIVFEKGFTRGTSGTVPLTMNGIGKDLKAWSITGNTLQNGTPTPENPVGVQAVGDRTANLFDYSTITTGYRIVWATGNLYKDDTGIMSDFIEVTEGQKYQISDSTKSLTAYIIGYNQNKEYLGAYDSFKGFIKSATNRYSVLTIPKESGCQYIKLMTFISYPINATSMFIEGEAVPNEFIPYGYKIPVVTRGKNLAGNYTVSSGYYYDDSGTPTSSDARFIRLSINVEPNTIYTISSNLKFYSTWEFNNNTKISRRGSNNSNKYTIKTSKECNSLRISMINTSGEADTSAFEWIQLEEGSTASPYEPYHEPITTLIYLPTPLYSGEVMRSDGSRDVKLKGTNIKNIKWKYDSELSRFVSDYIDNTIPVAPVRSIIGYSDIYECLHNGEKFDISWSNKFYIGADGRKIQIYIHDTRFNNVNDFVSSVGEYKIYFPVDLTTETFTAPQIPTLNGTTVIDVDTAVKPTKMYTKYKSSK